MKVKDNLDTIVRNHLEFLKGCQNGRTLNLADNVKNDDFGEDIQNISYWRFVDSGDGHYLVARLLFFQNIFPYAMFCGSQCIENYLKGYLKYRGSTTLPQHHKLLDILAMCVGICLPSDRFITSEKVKIIIKKFNPFNELARYPVQLFGPGNGYSFDFPHDLYILDYFVKEMRSIIPNPGGQGDLFTGRNISLSISLDDIPEMKELFERNNLNFSPEINTKIEEKHSAVIRVSLEIQENSSKLPETT